MLGAKSGEEGEYLSNSNKQFMTWNSVLGKRSIPNQIKNELQAKSREDTAKRIKRMHFS